MGIGNRWHTGTEDRKNGTTRQAQATRMLIGTRHLTSVPDIPMARRASAVCLSYIQAPQIGSRWRQVPARELQIGSSAGPSPTLTHDPRWGKLRARHSTQEGVKMATAADRRHLGGGSISRPLSAQA